MKLAKLANRTLFVLSVVVTGSVAVAFVWALLFVMNLGISFVWDNVGAASASTSPWPPAS